MLGSKKTDVCFANTTWEGGYGRLTDTEHFRSFLLWSVTGTGEQRHRESD